MPPEGTYFISKIFAYRKHPIWGPQYLVKWEGYPWNQSTWEPYRRLKNALAMNHWELSQGRIVY